MHPKALLDACAELVRLTLQFNHPADAVVSRFFRDNRNLGPRERATLSETVFKVLRQKLLYEHMLALAVAPKNVDWPFWVLPVLVTLSKARLTTRKKNGSTCATAFCRPT